LTYFTELKIEDYDVEFEVVLRRWKCR